MSYEFGTNDLGIKNPYKKDGLIRGIAGVIITCIAAYFLANITGDIQDDTVIAWLDALIGFILLAVGLKKIGGGLFATFKFYVGRGAPNSLTENTNPSDNADAIQVKTSDVSSSAVLKNGNIELYKYSPEQIENMLVGRKNLTFTEPRSWIDRMVYSIFPKMIFLPQLFKQIIEAMSGFCARFVVATISFVIAYSICGTGLIGPAGDVLAPILSLLYLCYIGFSWFCSSSMFKGFKNHKFAQYTSKSLAVLIVISILIPVLFGFIIQKAQATAVIGDIRYFFENYFTFTPWLNLFYLIILIVVVFGAIGLMLKERMALTTPTTEVCEFKGNFQESIHPSEIFINVDNIILGNRRFKELPNRIYQDDKPDLNDETASKGSFKGQSLIETQPEPVELNYSKAFKKNRICFSIISQAFIVLAAGLFVSFVFNAYDCVSIYMGELDASPADAAAQLSSVISMFFFLVSTYAAGIILGEAHKDFIGELQFSSLLMWIKIEGTYTESKISTGMSVYDSTRSENHVVRSSITPWIITSRILSSTFAVDGLKRLECSRYVMGMFSNQDEMDTIVSEMNKFLRDRENIAAVTNEKDLKNTKDAFYVNQATRSDTSTGNDPVKIETASSQMLDQVEQSDENEESE